MNRVNKIEKAQNYIEFSVLYLEEEYKLRTYWGEYSDLRTLINVKLRLDDFGQCGGLGRCATCMVNICLPGQRFSDTNQMACEVSINDDLSNAVVKIIGDSYLF